MGRQAPILLVMPESRLWFVGWISASTMGDLPEAAPLAPALPTPGPRLACHVGLLGML